MGLDWCVMDKIREGREPQAARLRTKIEELSNREELTPVQERRLQSLQRHYDKVTISAEETIGAPRIGIDEQATAWFKKEIWEPNHEHVCKDPEEATQNLAFYQHWSRPFEECFKEAYGKYVIDLADYDKSTCVGLLASGTSFRGKIIGFATFLSDELRGEAYEDHDADGCLSYGERLGDAVLEHLQETHPDDYGEDTISALLVKFDALKEESKAVYEAALSGKSKADATAEDRAAASEQVEVWEEALPTPRKALLNCTDVLNASRWLLFWGDKSHGFHAWY